MDRRRRSRRAYRFVLTAVVAVIAWTEAVSFVVPRPSRANPPPVLEHVARRAAPAPTILHVAAASRTVRTTPAPPPSTADDAPRRQALLIGINGAPGTSPLLGSRTDALTMRTALVGYGFKPENITMLLDEQATHAAIVGALDDLAARSTPSGITVVAIATHSAAARRGQSFSVWDGRISGHLLARRLSAVRGRVWTMLAMCYAGGYALPGVVGPGRVAIFSSSASEQSWQLGSLGSFAMMYIVKSAMIERRAPKSVEAAFAYGRRRMEEDDRRVLPIMSDGVPGDLVLGLLPTPAVEAAHTASPSPSPAAVSPPPTTPSPTPPPSAAPTPGVAVIDAILGERVPTLVR